MKVLWLCNIMLPAVARYLHLEASNKEGWLDGLMSVVTERQAGNGICLAVAFPAEEKLRLQVPVGDGHITCYGFVNRFSGEPHRYDPALEEQFREITEDFAPDVIHCFGTEYPHTLAMCRIFPRKDRILVGIQGLCAVYANAYFAGMPREVRRKVTLRDILRRDSLFSQQQKFVRRGEMEMEAIRLAGNVTGRTDWDRHYTHKWNPQAVYYPMNETLRSEFYTECWSEENSIPHSIFISQGDYPIKGLHYMLTALPRIRESYPDVSVYVAGGNIVGNGSLLQKIKISAYGSYLRQLIKNNHLEDCVHFLGRLDAAAMKEQYLKSSLFVCCSSIENSPNSLGEAMLLGMPCISTNVGGVASIFTDGVDGILCRGYATPQNDFNNGRISKAERETDMEEIADSLVNAIVEIWSQPEKMRDYCQNARKHAKNTHDREKNYQKMTEIYASIVRGEKGGDSVEQSKASVIK